MTILPLIQTLEEGVVYQVDLHPSKNSKISIQIIGTGSVDVKTSINKPTSLNDSILTLEDQDLESARYVFDQDNYPNFIKFEENQTGSRTIISQGLVFTNLNLS